MSAADSPRLVYRGEVDGMAAVVGENHPFADRLADGEFELAVSLVDDTLQVRDSRAEGLVAESSVGSRDLRILDPEREVLAEGRRALEPLAGDGSVELTGETTVDVAGETVEGVELTVPLGRFALRVTVAPDAPVSDPVAESVASLLVPVELPVAGLPVRVRLTGGDDRGVTLSLASVGDAEGERYRTDGWERATADDLLDVETDAATAATPPDQSARTDLVEHEQPGAGGGAETVPTTTAMRTRTAALSGSYHPDAGWLVRQGYLEDIRTGINDVLGGFDSFNVDLRGDEIDWWSDVVDSLDEDDPRLELLQQVAALLATTEGFGRDLPAVLARLLSSVDVERHLESGAETFEDRRSGDESIDRNDLPESMRPFFDVWNSQGGQPPELLEWFALAATVHETSSDFEKELGTVAGKLWDDLLATMGETGGPNRPAMPGAPLDIDISESERSFSETVQASDVHGDVNLPGWVDDLARIEVTTTAMDATFPDEKLSRLTVVREQRDDEPDVPVVAGTLSVEEMNVSFNYTSRPAFSVGSVAGIITTGGRLAVAVTAGGAGVMKLQDVDLPFLLEPTTENGRAGYEVRTEQSSVGNTRALLANYNLASMMTTLVASVWLSHDEGYVSDVVDDALEEADFLGETLQAPNAWPRSWSLRDPPSADPFGTDEAVLDPGSDSYTRGRTLARESYGEITVPRVGRDGTTKYDLSSGPNAAFDVTEIGGSDAGLVFSQPYLEAWLLERVGLLPEYYDGSLDPLLDDIGVTLPPLQQHVKAGELEGVEGLENRLDDGPAVDVDDADVDPRRGQRVPGVGYCERPGTPGESRRRVERVRRSTPTFATPPDGVHEHALELQLQYDFVVKDEHVDPRWVPEVQPERCFEVGQVPEGIGVGPVIEGLVDERVREVMGDLLGVPDLDDIVGTTVDGNGDGDGDGGSDRPDPRESDRDADAEEFEEFVESQTDGETQPPTQPMSLTVPGRGPGGDREIQVVCVPAQCEWRPAADITTLETYLAATVTVRAQVELGFSIFGPLDVDRGRLALLQLFANSRLRSRFRGGGDDGGLAALAGWLPQVNLRVDATGPENIDADASTDVHVAVTGGPVADVSTDTIETELLEWCTEDAFEWLRPVANTNLSGAGRPRMPVSDEGSLVSDTLAVVALSMLGHDVLAGDDADADAAEIDRVTGLVRLVGRSDGDDDEFGTVPDHVVDGDYVYVPVELHQELTSMFE